MSGVLNLSRQLHNEDTIMQRGDGHNYKYFKIARDSFIEFISLSHEFAVQVFNFSIQREQAFSFSTERDEEGE